MKSSVLLSLSAVALAAAVATPKDPQTVLQNPQVTIDEPDQYLIELSPGETRWVTEDDKWALRRVCDPSAQAGRRPCSKGTNGCSKTSTSSTSLTAMS